MALTSCRETVSNENPDAFFPFVDSLIHSETLVVLDKLTPEAAHQYALEIATAKGFISGTDVLSAVEMNLALHSATPKIEAFYHHYLNHASRANSLDCGSWVDWYGTAICDVETLTQLVGTESIDSSNKTAYVPSYHTSSLLILLVMVPLEDQSYLLLTTSTPLRQERWSHRLGRQFSMRP